MTVTQSTDAPLVAVVGATGQQGGSVVEAVKFSSHAYRIRAFTRDASKPAAKALASEGVEVHTLDICVENEAQIYKAFQGVDIVFIMTAFTTHFNPLREVAEGKLMIDAAHAASAKRVLWSGLPSISKISGGKYTTVAQFDSKATVTEYGRAKFAGSDTAFVNVDVGGYAQNFATYSPIYYGFPPDPTGKITVSLPAPPTGRSPIIDIRDYGKFVLAAIEDPKYASGGEIFATTEWIVNEDIAKGIAKASGKNVVYEQVDKATYLSRVAAIGLPEFLGISIVDAFAAISEFDYYGGNDFTKIVAKLTTWEEWVASQDWSKVFP